MGHCLFPKPLHSHFLLPYFWWFLSIAFQVPHYCVKAHTHRLAFMLVRMTLLLPFPDVPLCSHIFLGAALPAPLPPLLTAAMLICSPTWDTGLPSWGQLLSSYHDYLQLFIFLRKLCTMYRIVVLHTWRRVDAKGCKSRFWMLARSVSLPLQPLLAQRGLPSSSSSLVLQLDYTLNKFLGAGVLWISEVSYSRCPWHCPINWVNDSSYTALCFFPRIHEFTWDSFRTVAVSGDRRGCAVCTWARVTSQPAGLGLRGFSGCGTFQIRTALRLSSRACPDGIRWGPGGGGEQTARASEKSALPPVSPTLSALLPLRSWLPSLIMPSTTLSPVGVWVH